MATAAIERPSKTLNDAELKEHLQRLRQADNLTNWYYLIRSYLVLALVIGGAVYFYEHRVEWGLAWAWNLLVTFVAVVLVTGLVAVAASVGPARRAGKTDPARVLTSS